MKRIKIYDIEEYDDNLGNQRSKQPKSKPPKLQYEDDPLSKKKKDNWIGINKRNENRR
jgi:hypothetical protein